MRLLSRTGAETMGTVQMYATSKLVDDQHLPEYHNRQIAILKITHDDGTVEEHEMQSNAVINGVNNWVQHGYTFVAS